MQISVRSSRVWSRARARFANKNATNGRHPQTDDDGDNDDDDSDQSKRNSPLLDAFRCGRTRPTHRANKSKSINNNNNEKVAPQ